MGGGAVAVGNLFAYRATQPADLRAALSPVGPENDLWLELLAEEARVIVAAWGNDGRYRERDQEVLALLSAGGRTVYCLGLTTYNVPRHPRCIRAGTALASYSA